MQEQMIANNLEKEQRSSNSPRESVYLSTAQFLEANARKSRDEPLSNSDTSYGSSSQDSFNPVLTESPETDEEINKHIEDLISELRLRTTKTMEGKGRRIGEQHRTKAEILIHCQQK